MVDSLKPGRGATDTVAELLLLEQLPGVGPVTVRRLVGHFGSARAALGSPRAAFGRVAGREAAAARGGAEVCARVEKALAQAADLGVEAIGWGDRRYPAELLNLADPPPVLFVRGRVELLRRTDGVCVVGARRATARGRQVAERLGGALGRAGIVTVSGLALGVDGAVHAGVLSVDGAAVAVLGSGPDVVYPRAHHRLFARILERGLLVSEFVPGTKAAPHHFPRRNRILAALAKMTIVVEAGRRSGSLITVDHALDLGREVWSVPGPIDSAACAGSNRLLVDGARPLVSIGDFVTGVVGTREASTGDPAVASAAAATGRATARGLEARILDALATDTLAIDEIAARLSLPAAKALALLTTLELHGEVERVPGMRFRRAA